MVFSLVIKNNIPINKFDDGHNLLDMKQVTLPIVEQTTLDEVEISILPPYFDAFKELAK